MRNPKWLGVFASLMLASPMALAQGAGEKIYGSQLMTQEERNEFRDRMGNAQTAEERERIRSEHHAEMQERARERGVTLPDMPPARGMGQGPRGMGQGQGRGR